MRRVLPMLLFLLALAPGCATPTLWDWAREIEPLREVGPIESATIEPSSGLLRVRFAEGTEVAWPTGVVGLDRLRLAQKTLAHWTDCPPEASDETRTRIALETLEPLPRAADWNADRRAGTLALIDARVRTTGRPLLHVQILALLDSRTGKVTTTVVDAWRPPPRMQPFRLAVASITTVFTVALDGLLWVGLPALSVATAPIWVPVLIIGLWTGTIFI